MKIITISGKAQNGKDTTAAFMKEALESDGYTVLITHYADLLKYICQKFFGWDGEKDQRGRGVLQYVGTDVVRAKWPDFWVDFIGNVLDLFPDKWDYVLIPDCRFQNEIYTLKRRGFDVTHLRIVRDGFENHLTQEQQNHPSETALDGTEPGYVIHNSGSLDDLRVSVAELLIEMNGYHQVTMEECAAMSKMTH